MDIVFGSPAQAGEFWWVHGALAIAIGIVILFAPKILFYLLGGYLIVTGGIGFFEAPGEPVMPVISMIFGVLILILPKLIAYLFAAYLLIFGIVAILTVGLSAIGILAIVLAILLFAVPNLIPYLVAAFLIVRGGTILAAPWFG